MLPSSTTSSSKRSLSAMLSMPPDMSRRSNSSMQPPAASSSSSRGSSSASSPLFAKSVGEARIEPFVQSVGGARIKPFAQSVGALAYYTIIIQCIVVSDGGIIPLCNTAGILSQLYIRTSNWFILDSKALRSHGMLSRILFLALSILGQFFGVRVSFKASHFLAVRFQRSLMQESLALASTHKPQSCPQWRTHLVWERCCKIRVA